MKVALEICLDSVESAIAAQEGGADRVELCDNLLEGGTTPSRGMIQVARQRLEIGLDVMVRPRGGDFLYTPTEFEVMALDVETIKECGADGIVIGLLRPDGTVDRERTAKLVERARPLSVTFHRAFDMSRDPRAALEELIDLGVDRILSSGQAPSVPQGLGLLRELVQQAGERITIMPGGGITVENARAVVAGCQAREIHVGDPAAETVESAMVFRNPKVYMGDPEGCSEYAIERIAAHKIRKIVESLAALG
jgi:copper homeostasis protein